MVSENWDKLVSGEELNTVKAKRSKTFVENKERAIALEQLISEGWHKHKELKDKRFLVVKKDKLFDEVFEDKVWSLFANMGYLHMNKDRHFKISYDQFNQTLTQQIDVFAADEETAIIIECKAAEKMKDGTFKTDLEALHGQMDGIQKEIRKRFKNVKIKFIFATSNYIIGSKDIERMKEWDIVHFNESTINYYSELVKHLGSSAKYQLLGNLFANKDITNMDEKVPAIQGKMGGHTYYSFSIEPERLLKIGYVLHRNEAHSNMMPTYQRIIKKSRLKSVKEFVSRGGYFPNSLIISIDSNGKQPRFDSAGPAFNTELQKLGVLYLPKKYRSAYIIDGQHRLYGYSDSKYARSNSIPVVAFIDLDRQEQINLFMQINENQKSVSKSLRVTLNADMLWDSADKNEQRQALRSKISQMFGEKSTSPLRGRVVVGEDEKSQTKCITVEAIQQALKKTNFLTTFSKNQIVKNGSFDNGDIQSTCDLLYTYIEGCFKYVRQFSDDEWESGEGNFGIITINRGIQGLIRVMDDIVNLLMQDRDFNPKNTSSQLLIKESQYYLDPLIEYFNNLSVEVKKELRGYFGGGADNRFYRTFQKAISDSRSDFKPEGLDQYWENEARVFNDESITKLRMVERLIKDKINSQLSKKIGENWLISAAPKTVYQTISHDFSEANYESYNNDGQNIKGTIWDFSTIEHCREIILYGRNWSSIFEGIFSFPPDERGSKEKKTEWIDRVYKLQKKLQKLNHSITREEFDFICKVELFLHRNDHILE